MKFHNSKFGGYITVYCAMTFMVLISFVMLLIEGARRSGDWFMAEYALDIGMDSILGEYHKELFNRYSLLFVDSSYGTANPSADRSAAHLKEYVDRNISLSAVERIALGPDLYRLSVREAVIDGLSLATDDNGKVFRRQAEDERRQMLGLDAINSFVSFVGQHQIAGMDSNKYESIRESVESGIANAKEIEIEDENSNITKLQVNNPAEGINSLRGTSPLVLAISDSENLSKSYFSPNERLENRILNKGVGVDEERLGPETEIDRLLFRNYLGEYFGCYTNQKDDSYMKYEIEYLLAGKCSDVENLETVARRLLAFREVSNIEYLISNETKRMEIKALAMTVEAIAFVPGLETLIEWSIIFGWSFAESIVDLKTLYKGEKVPVIKTDSTWKTDLMSAMGNSFAETADASGPTGLSYEEYLKLFLFAEDIDKETNRALNLMELTIRQTSGNANFRIDGCFDSAVAHIDVTDEYGNEFPLTRVFHY